MDFLLTDLKSIPRVYDPCIPCAGLVFVFSGASVFGLVFAYLGTVLLYKPFMKFSFNYLIWCFLSVFFCGYATTFLMMLNTGKPSLDIVEEALSEYPTNPVIREKIDNFQIQYRCCGGNSYLDYNRFNWTLSESTNDRTLVPSSCFDVLQTDGYTNNRIDTKFVFHKEFPLYKQGCALVVTNLYRHLALGFSVYCGCVLLYQLSSIFIMVKFYHLLKEAERRNKAKSRARVPRLDANDLQIEEYRRRSPSPSLRRRRFVPSEFMPHFASLMV